MTDNASHQAIDLTQQRVFSLGNVKVLPSQKTIMRGDHDIELEPKVMQVLVALHEAAPDVCDRQQLLERCWAGSVVGDDAIQRCIGLLRKHLREVPGVSIKTIARIGYLLETDISAKTAALEAARSSEPLPSIGVRKFECRVGEPSDQLFTQILSDDIASALSVHGEFRVVDLSIKEHDQSGFQLLGNSRRMGDVLRLNLKLSESGSTSSIVWSYKVDIKTDHVQMSADDLVIDLSGRVANEFMKQVTLQVLANENHRSAWASVIRANAAYQRIDLANLEQALAHAHTALDEDPNYGAAHAAMANALAAKYELLGGIFSDQATLAESAQEHCDQALSLDQDNPTVLAWVANAFGMVTRPAEGMAIIERAIELAPNHHIAHLYKARHHLYRQQASAALEALSEHERVAPRFPWTYWVVYLRAVAYFMNGDVAAADTLIDRAAISNPAYPYVWIGKILTAGMLGKFAQAASAARKLKSLEGQDSLTLQQRRVRHSYADDVNVAPMLKILERAWTQKN